MNKWQGKLFSIITILAMALALCPATPVNATGGSITGTITDPDDNPIITKVRVVLVSGWSEVASGNSDGSGSYYLDGLPFDQALAVIASDEDPDTDGYPGEFYNNVYDPSWAENILLTSGSPDRTDVNIKLTCGENCVGVENLTFNVRDGRLLSDVNIRQAIAYGIDRQAILEGAWLPYGTSGEILNSMVLPGLWYTAPNDDLDLTVYDFDPTTAQGILFDAGWEDTDADSIRENASLEELALDFITTKNNMRIASAALFKAQMAEIGIRVHVSTYLPGEFFSGDPTNSRLAAGDFDIAEFTWTVPDDDVLFKYYNIDDPTNYGGYSNPTLDGYYNDAKAAKVDGNSSAFEDSALNWQYIFSEDLPALPMFTRVGVPLPSITGKIAMKQPDPKLSSGDFNVEAIPEGGGPGYCWSGGYASYNILGFYEYTLNECAGAKNYSVVASGSGYTFNSVDVLTEDFSGDPLVAVAPDITPLARDFSGHVYKPNGEGWVGFTFDYELDGTPLTSPPTSSDGSFTLPDITDASTLFFPEIQMDGYYFEGKSTIYPPWGRNIGWIYQAIGTRNIYGRVAAWAGNQGCVPGVTITVSAAGALTQTTTTDTNGNFNLKGLEPLDTYVVTPTRTGCVFAPTSQGIDIRNGDLNSQIVFEVPNSGVRGYVRTTLGSDASLAYYLIATYTTAEGIAYSSSVNWVDGWYGISVPPNINGTLTISRLGGPAAFGYETAAATRTGITLTSGWSPQDFTLVPSRTISGTIVGQNGVPVKKNVTVDFGYGLRWTQPSIPVTAYSIKAQPKLYYLSPVENGIINSTPVRFLANLTTAPAVTAANFALNLKTHLLEGCLWSRSGNDTLVIPAGSMLFRPATLYGATLYPASLAVNDMYRCGLNTVYYSMRLPRGIVGNLEVTNHTLEGWGGVTFDGITYDIRYDYSVRGNKAITGRIYSPSLNIKEVNNDFGGGGVLVLRDAATNDQVYPEGSMESSFEFSIPMLEGKAYTLSINPDKIPTGFDANPFPMSKIVTANLTAADVDIPAASGFVLVRKPIDPVDPTRPVTGGGYFIPAGSIQGVEWAYPPINEQEMNSFKGFGFDLQVGLATTTFTDLVPAPVFIQPNGDPSFTFTGLTAGQLYRWRVRAVYETDKGPWLETAPRPTAPIINNGTSAYLPGSLAGHITFEWDAVVPNNYSGSPLKYVVQYGDNYNFPISTPTVPTKTVILPAVTGTSTSSSTSIPLAVPTIGTTFYWRVKVQNSAGVDISGWSPIQVFFNRYKNLTSPTFQRDSFGWSPEPIRFFAASANPTLPVDAYYYVTLSNDGFEADFHPFTFTRTPSGATPSARQFLNGLPDGTYQWSIAIINGNSWHAWQTPITGWTDGTGTITVP